MTIPSHRPEQELPVIAGEKYTLVIENTVGAVVTRQVRIHEANWRKYAQYHNALRLVMTYKGKRKQKGVMFLPGQNIAIGKGWQDIRNESDSWECFDEDLFKSLANQLKAPIFGLEATVSQA